MKRFVWLLIVIMLEVMTINDAYGQFPCSQARRVGRQRPVPEAKELEDSVSNDEEIDENENKFHVTLERVYSQNRKYYLKRIKRSEPSPFKNIEETIVYNAVNDSIIFRVAGYFYEDMQKDYLFMSNSGQSFCYLTISPQVNINPCNELYFFYSNGQKKTVKLDSLINPKIYKCDELIYYNLDIRQYINSFELSYSCSEDSVTNTRKRRNYLYDPDIDSSLIIADSYPIFLHNDTLFIISWDLEIIQIDMQNLNINKTSYNDKYDYFKTIVNNSLKKCENYTYEAFYYLQDEYKLGKFLENNLGMKLDETRQRNFEYYYLNIEGFLYKDGRFEVSDITCDSIFSKSKIKEWAESLTYKTDYIPEFSDRWSFTASFNFRNNEDSLAYAEYKEIELKHDKILKENPYKDSIDGVYIPKDLYEAIDIIDKNISENDRNELLNMNECDFMELSYHNGLSITSDWSIYENSRIYNYFKEFGISEPEIVTHCIEAAYWYYLRDSLFCLPNLNYDKFILNKDLLLYIEQLVLLDTNYINLDFEKIITDSSGTKFLFPAFEKSKYVNFTYEYNESYFSTFVNQNINNNSKHFLPYFENFINQSDILILNTNKVCLDSILFFEDSDAFELSELMTQFKYLLTNSDTSNYLDIKSYYIFYDVSKNEIDSLDLIFANLNKEIRETSESLYSSGEDDSQINMLKSYFRDRFASKLYVIKLYPYIKFDFKEYKKKAKERRLNKYFRK